MIRQHTRAVDVTICTYNSARMLDQCLRSIKQSVPVHTIWVVDNHSTDDTVPIARQFGCHVVPFSGSLAEARAISFRLVQTPLFVNVDSDMVLCHDWYAKMMRHWTDDAGCVWGIAVDQHPLQKAYAEAMWKIRNAERYDTTHLPNMIARTAVLRDIEFPEALRRGSVANEDFVVKQWIERQGWRCIVAPVRSQHFSYPTLINHKSFWCGASMRLSKAMTLRALLLRTALSLPQGIVTGLISHNARLVPYMAKLRWQMLYGYLHPQQFYNLKRN